MRTPKFWRSLFARAVYLNTLGYLLTFVLIFGLISHYQYQMALKQIDTELLTMAMLFIDELETESPSRKEFAQLVAKYGEIQGKSKSVFHVYDAEGTIAHWNPNQKGQLPQLQFAQIAREGFVYRTSATGPIQHRWLDLLISDQQVLQIGFDLSSLKKQRTQFLGMALLALLGMFILGSSLGGLFMIRGLGGIKQVANAAEVIRDGADLNYRVPTTTGSLETDALAQTFNQMLERLESSVTLMREAMDNIAHDLKKPIMRIQVAVEQAGGLVQGESIHTEIAVMKDLLENILEISVTELGVRQWKVEACDLVALLEEGCSFYNYIAEEKGQKLVIRFPQVMAVKTDVKVIQRIFSNLLDNALKYSPAGSAVTLGLTQNAGMFKLTVTDQGMGIAHTDLANIFNRFFRAEPSRSEPGHGLGLSYCRATIEAMGGTIAVTSLVGKGAQFTITLPKTLAVKS